MPRGDLSVSASNSSSSEQAEQLQKHDQQTTSADSSSGSSGGLYGYDDDYIPQAEDYPELSGLPATVGRGGQVSTNTLLQYLDRTYQHINQIENKRETGTDQISDYATFTSDWIETAGVAANLALASRGYGSEVQDLLNQLAEPVGNLTAPLVDAAWLPIYSAVNLIPDLFVAFDPSTEGGPIHYNPDVRPYGFFSTDQFQNALQAGGSIPSAGMDMVSGS